MTARLATSKSADTAKTTTTSPSAVSSPPSSSHIPASASRRRVRFRSSVTAELAWACDPPPELLPFAAPADPPLLPRSDVGGREPNGSAFVSYPVTQGRHPAEPVR